MVQCGECKTTFPAFTALKDHFRTYHRVKFVAICLWLGSEKVEQASMDDWHWYELRFTRVHPSGKVVGGQEEVQNENVA
jgi:hypothetical protein